MKLTRRGLLGGYGCAGACGRQWKRACQRSAKWPCSLVRTGCIIRTGLCESFLDLREDQKEAADAGKHFAILWEQRGCPYCREMHRVNFVHSLKRANIFRKISTFCSLICGGRARSPISMARKWANANWRSAGGSIYTPTMNFFPKDPHQSGIGKIGRKAEVFRMPGYFKLFHFMASPLNMCARDAQRKSVFSASCRKKAIKCARRARYRDVGQELGCSCCASGLSPTPAWGKGFPQTPFFLKSKKGGFGRSPPKLGAVAIAHFAKRVQVA